MRRCLRFFSRSDSRHTTRPDNDDNAVEEAEVNEKRVRTPRDGLGILLTVVRCLQLAYFAFVYLSLRGFQRSSYFRQDGPWQHSPEQMHHDRRTLRWARAQASMTLIYHFCVLFVPCLLRLLKANRRPYAGLAAVFGDGCAMVAMVNTVVMLDSAHHDYCHRPPSGGGFDFQSMLSLGRNNHHHDMRSHRSVCKSLDLIFGVGGLVIMSHLTTAFLTAWLVKRKTPTIHAKIEQANDVEQAVVQRPPRVEQPSAAPTPQRQHSPPPPYRSGVPEFAESRPSFSEYPPRTSITAGRTSVETTSSLGIENYLVSDGWRAPEMPPEYSSRPPSLHQGIP